LGNVELEDREGEAFNELWGSATTVLVSYMDL